MMDWSSDVCSSDLAERPSMPGFGRIHATALRQVFNGTVRVYQAWSQRRTRPRIKPSKYRTHFIAARVQARNRGAVLAYHLGVGRSLQADSRAQRARVYAQSEERSIGRASSRESVCQDG